MDKEIKFNEKQKIAYEKMIRGENVFITGPSGVGKSKVVQVFRNRVLGIKKVGVTSTTGISAVLIGGTTLHSFLGIGLGKESVEILEKQIRKNGFCLKRWKELEVLIIDEISMLSPELFDKLEELARRLRCTIEGKNPPFGGIQLIISGDFLQLPVIGSDKYCFEAKSWPSCIRQEDIVYLTEIIRQKDIEFQTILNEIRCGFISEKSKKVLTTRVDKKLENKSGIKPTIIHTVNIQVDNINQKELEKLDTGDTEYYEYKMLITRMNGYKGDIDKIKKTCTAQENLVLCEGAQVMLLINLDIENELVNGSRGVIIGFENDLPIVKFLSGMELVIDFHVWEITENNKKIYKVKQIPLKLAYAITVHKSQGSTLDYAVVNLSKTFSTSMGYVALSRVRTLEGLSIIGMDENSIKADPKALEFYKRLV